MGSALEKRHKREWEELARVDPFWSVLAQEGTLGGGWDPDEFFRTGEVEVNDVLAVAAGLGYPVGHERALDFGCAVGRLTRALAGRFEEVVGVDISEEMVNRARELNADRPNSSFLVNSRADLALFQTGTFDFVYSSIVLQHLPRKSLIAGYISELVRVLKAGGIAVFQTLSYMPPARRVQPRRRAYALLRRLGVPKEFLVLRLKLAPMRMLAISDTEVRAAVERSGGVVEHVEPHENVETMRSLRYYVRLA